QRAPPRSQFGTRRRPAGRRLALAQLRPSPASPPPRRLDRGDVDLLHRHHRVERPLRLGAAGSPRVHQYAWVDLPGDAPPVLAPAAVALLAAVADDRVPVTVRLFL